MRTDYFGIVDKLEAVAREVGSSAQILLSEGQRNPDELLGIAMLSSRLFTQADELRQLYAQFDPES